MVCIQWQPGHDNMEDEKDSYEYLFEDMIDNYITNIQLVIRVCHNASKLPVVAIAQVDDTLIIGRSTNITPTKCKQFKITDSGTKIATTYTQQGSCSAPRCSSKSTFICSQCQDDGNDDILFCGT